MGEIGNIDNLQQLCEQWQKILRLQDWQVKVEIVRHWEISGAGHISYVLSNKTAIIQILDVNDHNPARIMPMDQEWTLVHELVHLHFAPLELSDDKEIMEEWAVQSISHALIRGKRGVGFDAQGQAMYPDGYNGPRTEISG